MSHRPLQFCEAAKPSAVGVLAIAVATVLVTVAAGDSSRVLPPGQKPDDWRLAPLKDLNGYFPFEPSASVEAWEARSRTLRRELLVALGLWPMPEATPAHAVVHSRREFGDFTVENVFFESLPGLYVTGNLYRPVGQSGRRPGVLCPHGHFPNGRFCDTGRDAVREQIVIGAERFEESGRNVMQARSVQLARMGCVVFQYDMIGYCDSAPLSFELAHRFGKQRPELNQPDGWGLFTPQAESHLQSVMGLQTYNSIRALDWLAQLPDVDPQRIGVTGASGGGTQTFILGAVDTRPAVLVPAVMVSTAMQGGCTCENCSLLRVDEGNIAFAALIAPRPLCLISADDWTREMAAKGFPELDQHYRLLGQRDRLEHHPLIHFGHNYNYVSRARMYHFFNRHFELGLEVPIVEADHPLLTSEQLTVWNDDYPRPQGGVEAEVQLLRRWTEDAARQLTKATPRDAASLKEFRRLVQPALDAIFRRRAPAPDRLDFELVSKTQHSGYLQMTGLVQHRPQRQDGGRPNQQESLPTVFLMPDAWKGGKAAIWLHTNGKAGLFLDGQPAAAIQTLLDAGVAVAGVDLTEQGELLSDEKQLTQTRRVSNPREAAAYTLGYNHSLFAQRVHDVLTMISFVAHHERQPSEVWLVGLDGAGPWAAAARAQADNLVGRAAIATGGFRFVNVDDIRNEHLLPGGAKYGDLPGMLAASAPQALWLADEDQRTASLTVAAYEAAGREDQLVWAGGSDPAEAVAWLTGE